MEKTPKQKPEVDILPAQYKGMRSEAVEEIWTIPQYVDPEKTASEQERKKQALEQLKAQEENDNQTENLSSEEKTSADSSIENADETVSSFEKFSEQTNVKTAIESIEKSIGSADSKQESVKSLLYDLLTKRAWLAEEQQKRGTKDLTWMTENYKEGRDWYRQAIESLESSFNASGTKTSSNPGWFSVTASERQEGKEAGHHYKVYETLNVNDYEKVTRLPKLIEKIKSIGAETGESIKVKIPGNFLGFVTHNDSIVVHCDNADTCQKIKEALATWESEEGLQPAPRELDRTSIALDGKTEEDADNQSFSQLVSTHVAKWVEQYKDSYPADILATEAVKHAISLSQKQPTIKSPSVKN